MRVITFKIDEDLYERLERYLLLTEREKSETIREALHRFLLEWEEKTAKEREKSERIRISVEKGPSLR